MSAGNDGQHADLRSDRPTAAELLEIIAETLSDSVVPATAPHAQHQARVAANLARMLARELGSAPEPMPSLPSNLVDADDATAAAAFVEVQALVQAKLAINKPGYDTHDAAAEAEVVA
ncbi:MAG: hypothetical protein AAF567_05595 [Actinomycetota bacterium]